MLNKVLSSKEKVVNNFRILRKMNQSVKAQGMGRVFMKTRQRAFLATMFAHRAPPGRTCMALAWLSR